MNPKLTLVIFAVLCCLLIILFFPTNFGNTREASRKTMCLSNIKQIATHTAAYAVDNNESFPPQSWVDALMPYAKNEDLFTCSVMERDKLKWGYAMNAELLKKKIKNIADPSQTIIFFETDALAKNVVANLAARSLDRHEARGQSKPGSTVAYVNTSAKFIQQGSPIRHQPPTP